MIQLDDADSRIAAVQDVTRKADPVALGQSVLVTGGKRAAAYRANAEGTADEDSRSGLDQVLAAAVLASKPAVGSLDRADHDELSGWVWDPARPNEAMDIEILDGDVVVLSLRADKFRADLSQAGIGDGRHGFRIHNLGGLFPLSRHRVRVRRAFDGLDLPKSPTWITRARLDDTAVAFIDQVITSAVGATSTADDLTGPLGQLVRLLGEVTNAYTMLARTERRHKPLPAATFAAGLELSGQAQALVGSLQATYPPLYFDPAPKPVVSVIMPVHNQFRYTYDCLRSIKDMPPDRAFEIILVDDGSGDETLFCALVLAGAVRILRNPERVGFVRSCNVAAAAASGRYLLFLGNDTIVRTGWLDALVETFEQTPDIGMAGAKLLAADGALLQAGGIVWRLGDTCHWGRGLDPADPRFSFRRDVDYVSSTALMMEHALFHELQGFDEAFAPAFYEDADLAFRVRARGRRVVMQPASEIVHLEAIAADTEPARETRLQTLHHSKFYRRWRDALLTHRFSGDQPDRACERLVRKRAYFVDDSVPETDLDAGAGAALDHMRLLMQFGYKVTFVPADSMARVEPYTASLQKLGIDCRYQPFCNSVEDVFRTAAVPPDLVYLHRYSNAATYAAMVRRYFPHCRIIFGVADLRAVRKPEAAAQLRAKMAAMAGVDCVLVHSQVEAEWLKEADARLNVAVVPWTVRPRPTPLGFHERSGAACVGGFGRPPNVDAAHYLSGEILPLLRERTPECTVYLVGNRMPDEVMQLQRPGLVPLGHMATLADLLHGVRCTIVPLRQGAGINGAVLESFAHGLPCVMSDVAAEGLELPDDLAWLVAHAPAEYAEKIARLHEDAACNARLSESGLAYITQRYSEPAIKAALRPVLG
jgi:GT2 family glycosyltransferase